MSTLLNCSDNPDNYLKKIAASGEMVSIRWLHAGWNDRVDVSTIRLKEVGTARPVRRAAAASGLLSQVGQGALNNFGAGEEDEDAPILKEINWVQEKERMNDDANDKDENYIDQEDKDELLLCHTRKSISGQGGISTSSTYKTSKYRHMSIKTEDIDTLGSRSARMAKEDSSVEEGEINEFISNDETLEYQPTTIKSEDIETDDDIPKSRTVRRESDDSSLEEGEITEVCAVKKEEIDTDDEGMMPCYKNVTPEQITSGAAVKTDYDTDTDTEGKRVGLVPVSLHQKVSATENMYGGHRLKIEDSAMVSSTSNHNKYKKAPPKFSEGHSADELIQIAHDHLLQLNPTSLAAFWNLLSRQVGKALSGYETRIPV